MTRRTPPGQSKLGGVDERQLSLGDLLSALIGDLDRSATSRFMKTIKITAVLIASVLLVGCGKKSSLPTSASSTATPAAQPAMSAWQQGDKSAAVRRFVETDWSTSPLFAPDSTLSLSEELFKALSDAERRAKSGEMMAQLDSLKKLAAAVAEAGRDAASKGDAAQAWKYFTSLKQCGTALDSPDSLRIVQLVGQAFKKMAGTELAKIPQ